MTIKNMIACAFASVALLAGGVAQAAIVPTGIHNDVTVNTVVNTWGWTQISESNYGGNMSIDDLFAGHGQYVMIGAMHKDSGVIDVLAADLYTTVTSYTALNTLNVSNNVGWYFNGYSMGFAGVSDTICQTTADTCGQAERDRLSWHTTLTAGIWNQDHALAPTNVYNGWRSGNNNWIYEGTDWVRVVFTLDGPSEVPEPASLLLVALGLAGFGLRKTVKSKRA